MQLQQAEQGDGVLISRVSVLHQGHEACTDGLELERTLVVGRDGEACLQTGSQLDQQAHGRVWQWAITSTTHHRQDTLRGSTCGGQRGLVARGELER
jgi:hypothetical protein